MSKDYYKTLGVEKVYFLGLKDQGLDTYPILKVTQEIEKVLKKVSLHAVQFHGDESREDLENVKHQLRPWDTQYVKKDLSGDALAGALATAAILRDSGKRVVLVGREDVSKKFSFLPEVEKISHDVGGDQGTLVVSIASGKNKIDKFWYEEKEGSLIYNIEGKKTELFLGFIPIDEHVTATYDNTGNLLNYHQKPWWQFWG